MPNPNVLKYVGRVTWLYVSGYDAFVQLEGGQLFHLPNADPAAAMTTCLYLSIFQVSAVTGQPVVVSVPRTDTAHIIGVDMAVKPPPAYAVANHSHSGVYEPVINPKNSAFNANFGTGNAEAARGDHGHAADYEPVINPKNSAFNANFGTGNAEAARGDHGHAADYEPVINPKNSAFNANFGTGNAEAARGDHGHAADCEPVINPKNSAFNANFGTGNAEAARGDHGHAADYEPVINPKNSAFNANFGTGNAEAARGDHGHAADYEPVINPKNSAFNANFGTGNAEAARGDHGHAADYEPVINPKNSAFNATFGTGNAEAARGNHGHDPVYNKKIVAGHAENPLCHDAATGEVWVDFSMTSAGSAADLQAVICGFGASAGGTSFFDIATANPMISTQGGIAYRLTFQISDRAGMAYDPATAPWNGRRLHLLYLVIDTH